MLMYAGNMCGNHLNYSSSGYCHIPLEVGEVCCQLQQLSQQ